MRIKKCHLFMVFGILCAISISMVFMTSLSVANATVDDSEDTMVSEVATETKVIEENTPETSAVSMVIGDIICQKGTGKLGGLIPGRYDHCQIFIGNGQEIESGVDGVRCNPVSTGDVFRVSTSSSVRQAAVNWVKTKIGLPYDYNLLSKQVNGNSYYCSELCWAAYKAKGGPDIDQNPGWSWTYFGAVAPTEIADDSDTYMVGTL